METLEIEGFFQFEIIMNGLVSSFCFIWIPCYGSTAIMHILHTYLSVRNSTLDVIYRRQVLRSKDGPRTERIKPLTAKLFNLNFHPLEVVSRWRDPQLQLSENYSDLTK